MQEQSTQFTLRRATVDDAERIQDIRIKAFETQIWARMMFPHGHTESTLRTFIDAARADLAPGSNVVYMLATAPGADGRETVVASSKWTVHPHPRPREEWDVPMGRSGGEGANQGAVDMIVGAMGEMRRKWVQGRAHVVLDRLETLPEWQGKGAGRTLLEWGLGMADGMGLPVWLESTDDGYGLYKRYGFQDVDVIKLDFSAVGYDERTSHVVMERAVGGEDGGGGRRRP